LTLDDLAPNPERAIPEFAESGADSARRAQA
jgi:hypothetical protein